MQLEAKRPYLVLALLVVAVSLPFLNQAVHIDDRIYLEVAENILSRPLHPYDYRPIFEGFQAEDAASHSHLPLTSYYLALVRLLTGSEREWVFHLAFLIFPLLAAWGMYDLAARFVRHPLEAAILLVLSPVFLVLSHTLMTDVPLLSLWVVAFSRFFALSDDSSAPRPWLILAGSLLAAAFISILTVIPLAVMVFATLVRRSQPRRVRLFLLVLLASPFLLWAAWFLYSYFQYGRFVLINTFLHMSQRATFDWSLLGSKAVSLTLNLGALFLAPVAVWFVLARGLRLRLAVAALWLAFVPFYLWFPDWNWAQTLFFAVFLATGLLLLISLLERLVRFLLLSTDTGRPNGQARSDGYWILMLWLAGAICACLVLYYSGSARYTLPALPAVVLFWMRELERGVPDYHFRRNLVWLAIVLTGGYSLLVGYADYRLAETYRSIARELPAEYGGQGRTVWITGEWGFRYYMNRAGAVTLLQTGTGPKSGDIVIKPYVAMPWVTLYDGHHLDLLEQRHAPVDFPIRILDFGSKAGFYSTGWGLLPFSWKEGERWEWFNVFKVKKEYEGPVPEPQQPW
jgi:hypothetical protein